MVKVWYFKDNDDESIKHAFLGYAFAKKMDKLPDPNNLEKTHTFLAFTDLTKLEDVFFHFQGEVWSPNGEAGDLIKSLDLHHTSMSVGDIIERDDGVFIVDTVGFVNLLTGERYYEEN
jgi:hypothetical protein